MARASSHPPVPAPPDSALALQPWCHPFGRGRRHRQGDVPAPPSRPRAPTTKTPPNSPAPTAAFAHAAGEGCNLQTTGDPSPPRRPAPSPVPVGWGWDGGGGTAGGHREVVPPPAGSGVGSLCNVIAAAGSAGVMHCWRTAPSRPRPILPAPHNYRHRVPGKTAGLSTALALAGTHQAEPEGAAPLAPRGPESRLPAPNDGDGFA